MAEPVRFDVYMDYLCPYVYTASCFLDQVKQELGDAIQINWKFFSLEQINQQNGPDWKLWEQGPAFYSRGLPAFEAAEAAARQGPQAFERMHLTLLRYRHEQRRKFTPDVLREAAQESGLDLAQFERDLADPALKQRVAREHTEAVERYNVFGTPTFVFPNGESAYLRLMPAPPAAETMGVWEQLQRAIVQAPYLHEIKRPVPPQPA